MHSRQKKPVVKNAVEHTVCVSTHDLNAFSCRCRDVINLNLRGSLNSHDPHQSKIRHLVLLLKSHKRMIPDLSQSLLPSPLCLNRPMILSSSSTSRLCMCIYYRDLWIDSIYFDVKWNTRWMSRRDLNLPTETPTIIHDLPILGAWGGSCVEDTCRIPLPPQFEQARIVGSPICLLPIRLLQVAFVHVGGAIRTSSPQGAVDIIRELDLRLLLLRPCCRVSDVDIGDREGSSVAPSGVDGIVDWREPRRWPHDMSYISASCTAHSVDDRVPVRCDITLGEQTSSDETCDSSSLVLEQCGIQVEESRVLCDGGSVLDTERPQFVEQWLYDFCDSCPRHIRSYERSNRQACAEEFVIDEHSVLNPARGEIMECCEASPEEVLVVRVQGHDDTRCRGLGVCLDGD